MISIAFAALLLTSAVQQDFPDMAEEPAAEAYVEAPANGHGDEAMTNEVEPYQPAEEIPAQPVEPSQDEAVEPSAEEQEDMVCRRTSFYDDYGRQRSRRVCRPRDEE